MDDNGNDAEMEDSNVEMTPEARAARAEYQREYRRKHPQLVKAQSARYWQKKADKIAAEKKNSANDR